GHVALDCVEAVLNGQHLVPVLLKRWDHLAVAGTVGPQAMGEHNTGLVVRGHDRLFMSLLLCSRSSALEVNPPALMGHTNRYRRRSTRSCSRHGMAGCWPTAVGESGGSLVAKWSA